MKAKVKTANKSIPTNLLEFCSELKYLPVSELRENPENFYQDEEDEMFDESIKREGILKPIIIDENNVILDGHRRYRRALKYKIERVPVIILKSGVPKRVLIALLNKYRRKSPREMYVEGKALEDYFKSSKTCAGRHKTGVVGEKVGEALGISRRQWHRLKYIFEHEDQARDIIKELESGKLTIYGAYKQVKKKLERKAKGDKTKQLRKNLYLALISRYPERIKELREICRSTKPLLKSKQMISEYSSKVRLEETRTKGNTDVFRVFVRDIYLQEEIPVKIKRKHLEALKELEKELDEVLEDVTKTVDEEALVKRVMERLRDEWLIRDE